MSKRVVLLVVVAGLLIGGCAKPRPTPTPVPASSPTAVVSTAAPSVRPSASPGHATGLPSPSTPITGSPAPSEAPTGSSAASQAPSGGPDSSDSAVALTVEAHDLSFRPSQLEASAGQPVTLAIHNLGRIVHNLTIDELQVQLIASPGETKSVDLAALPPGTYTFYCSVSGHRQAGMQGTLTVR